MSANGNGKIPIIGASAIDPERLALVRGNYQTLVQRVGALSVLMMDIPAREMIIVNRDLQGSGMLTVPQEIYAQTLNGLRVDAKVLDVLEQWQRIVVAARNAG